MKLSKKQEFMLRVEYQYTDDDIELFKSFIKQWVDIDFDNDFIFYVNLFNKIQQTIKEICNRQ